MKIAVLADIHANFDALQVVLEDAEKAGVDRFFSLGDNIGYGPEPGPVLNALWKHEVVSVMGNHEYALIKANYFQRLNPTAKESLKINLGLMDDRQKEYCRGLPLFLNEQSARFVHGCPPHSAVAYLFDPSPRMLGKIFHSFTERLAFYGHTHAFDYTQYDGAESVRTEVGLGIYAMEPHKRYLINPGSVGQPRDGINNQAKYLIWDQGAETVTFKAVAYDFRATIAKIKALELPEFNWERLLEW